MANYNKSFTLNSGGGTTTQNTAVGDTITCTVNSNNVQWLATTSNCTVSPTQGTNGTAVITTNSSGSFSCNFSYTVNKVTYFHLVEGTASADNTPENFVSGGWVGSGVTNTYYYATFNSSTTASTSSVGTYTVGSVSPGTSISLANVSGPTAAAYSINGSGTGWITSSNTVSNGDVIRWRVLSPSTASTTTRYRLTIGTVSRDLQITTASPSYTAPVISSVTNTTTAGPNVTATVNLSSNGSGGSLQYAQTTSNSVPSSGWQTSNQFSHPRGTTRYYWASQAQNTSGAYSSSVSKYVGYLTPDTAVAPSPTTQTIANAATSASVTVGSVARSSEGVAVRLNNGSTNLATATGNNQTLTWTSSLPTAGNTTTYEIFTRRATSTGGDGSTWYATNDTFTVTRSQPSATLDLNIGISNYSGPTRYYSNGNTVAASSTVVWMNFQTAYTHELTGCGADTIYYASYTSGASQGSTTAYSNLSPIARTWTTASTRSLNGISSSTAGINGPTYNTGDIVYIWAVLNPNSPGGSTIGNSTTMTYTGSSYYVERPDTLVGVTPSTTSLTATETTSPTVNVTSDSSGTQYRLYTSNINRWVSTYNGGSSSSADFTISYDESNTGAAGTGFTELPGTGQTFTYVTQCRVTSGTPDPVNGGGAAWVEVNNNGESFTIQRSAAANYSVSASPTTINEGQSTTYTVTTSNVTNGTTVGYSITGIQAEDLSAGSLTGTLTISSNTASTSITLANDNLTDGTDTARLTLNSTDSTGASTGSAYAQVTVNDTSQASGGTGTPTSGGTAGLYGLRITNQAGTQTIIDDTSRLGTFLASATITVNSNTNTHQQTVFSGFNCSSAATTGIFVTNWTGSAWLIPVMTRSSSGVTFTKNSTSSSSALGTLTAYLIRY